MDTEPLNSWRSLIKKILRPLAEIPFPKHVNLKCKMVCDEPSDVYLVVCEGWEKVRRLHGIMAHIEIRGDKIWIMLDGTEYGLANELLDAGVPRDRIVLGFKSPQVRQHTGFAVA